jgi:hypothetical protein
MPDPIEAEVRDFLLGAFGASARRSWGLDALYHRGRLFVLFDAGALVGKFPPELRRELRETVPGTHAFMNDDDSPEASWQAVPLAAIGAERAIELALAAAAYVHTAEGAPKARRRSRSS